MTNKKRHTTKTIRTTVGDLASAFYEAALAELHDETAAARIAQQMVRDAVKNRRVHI
jgi:hypothetical protein